VPPVELNVTRIEQKPGLCGAATAQMILHYKGLIGTSGADQDTLFAAIQANTGGVRPRGDINPHDCPQWPTQECTRCAGVETFTCWCTYPPALEATLNQAGPPVVVALSSHNNDQSAATQVLRSVDFDLPPAVLVSNGNHWLVVAGYNTAAAPGQGVAIDGREITDIFVRNPTVGAANQLITIGTWIDDYQSPVNLCGPFLNMVAVIGATAQTGGTVPAPTTPGNVRVGRRPVPKKPPKPKKPKPKKPKPKPPKPPRPPRGPKRRTRRE